MRRLRPATQSRGICDNRSVTADENAIPRAGDAPDPPRDSATVILARDGGPGLEIYMLERHIRSDFVGGAMVFPGGKVDDADCAPEVADLVDGTTPAEAAQLVEAPDGRGLGFHVAAIRETFEEAGVLLARAAGGRLVDESLAAQWRPPLVEGRETLVDLARRERLRLAADLLHYFSRWITPEGLHRRYDARFFVAEMPAAQTAAHDAVETTSGLWVRPQEALDRARAGELTIIFPTRKTLEELAAFPGVEALVDSTRGKHIEGILPKVVTDPEGRPAVVLPHDSRYHAP